METNMTVASSKRSIVTSLAASVGASQTGRYLLTQMNIVTTYGTLFLYLFGNMSYKVRKRCLVGVHSLPSACGTPLLTCTTDARIHHLLQVQGKNSRIRISCNKVDVLLMISCLFL